MLRTHLFDWYKRFKEGREVVKNDLRRRRPSTSRTVSTSSALGRWCVATGGRLFEWSQGQLDVKEDHVWNRRYAHVWKVTGLSELSMQQLLIGSGDPLYRNNLSIHLILLPVTFFLFPRLKGIIKGPVLRYEGHRGGA